MPVSLGYAARYEITSPLGAGGMGVAIKILPPEVATDPERQEFYPVNESKPRPIPGNLSELFLVEALK